MKRTAWDRICGFWTSVFCENGIPSSKRILGSICILVCLFFTWLLIQKDFPAIVIESLIQTELITGAALLGISNITDIWKKKPAIEESE